MKKNSKGQSTIEFILTFTTTVGFIFLFLKMAMNYTNGYMVQHAVFMASRGYLVHDSQVGDVTPEGEVSRDATADRHAKSIFDKYLPNGLIKGFTGVLTLNDPENQSRLNLFVGAFVEFEQVFSMGIIGGKDKMLFRAESFLGREPTRFETYVQICESFKAVIGSGDCKVDVTLDDNGG